MANPSLVHRIALDAQHTTHLITRHFKSEREYDGPPVKRRRISKADNPCDGSQPTFSIGFDSRPTDQDSRTRTRTARTIGALDKNYIWCAGDEVATTEVRTAILRGHETCPSATSNVVDPCSYLSVQDVTHYGVDIYLDATGFNDKSDGHYERDAMSVQTKSADVSKASTTSVDSTMVCYGMLNDLKFKDLIGSSISESIPAQWDGTSYLQDAWNGSCLLKLSEFTHELLRTLASQAQVSFQFWLRPSNLDHEDLGKRQPTNYSKINNRKSLSAIMYGPLDLASAVGDWLNTAQVYLQMPRGCFLDVQYKNPHCLSFDDCPASTTGDLKLMDVWPGAHRDVSQQEDFAGLYTDNIYDEAQQPAKISSRLHSHQKIALSFLLNQESGWDHAETKAGIWKRRLDSFGTIKYENTLTGTVQGPRPSEFRGGILADEMGLGKTCTMLSLIAADIEKLEISPARATNGEELGTLVVVPFALLQVWEKQICQHFKPNCMKWKILHGADRKATNKELQKFDIVITTFNTVTLEWRQHKKMRDAVGTSVLFSTPWRRVILDEAHVIRNKATLVSKAVCALPSDRRWCITGTPIQNRLGDLYGLLRFLKVEPYHQFKDFETDFLRPWKSHNDQVALKRLLYLMKAIAIRRPRSIISLPDRHEITETVQFSSHERMMYNSAREGVIEVLEAAAASEQNLASTYINAFQRINEMRYVCNHGTRPLRRQIPTFAQCQGDSSTADAILDQFDDLVEANGINCAQCGTDLQEDGEDDENFLKPSIQMSIQAPEISRQLCRDCLHQSARSSLSPGLSRHSTKMGDSPSPPPITFHGSSKIISLLNLIHRLPPSEKSVVFSYWTSTLTAISGALSEAGITSLQYDGSLSRVKRDQALADLANDPSVRVMLVSITCGGQGLDLTAANHAFLFEPQWNPMLEEQAMSRVHRLGQTKPVRLVRFVVKGTWEEKIRVLQERKRNLVDLIIEKRNLKDGDEGRKQLHFLRELIS